jgi:hypothetical protein
VSASEALCDSSSRISLAPVETAQLILGFTSA